MIAFSPGFIHPPVLVGSPRAYVSHGAESQVLPVDLCNCRVVPRLKEQAYDVNYCEFDGPPTVPDLILQEALG